MFKHTSMSSRKWPKNKQEYEDRFRRSNRHISLALDINQILERHFHKKASGLIERLLRKHFEKLGLLAGKHEKNKSK